MLPPGPSAGSKDALYPPVAIDIPALCGDSPILSLLSMIACLILGMEVPTTLNYVIMATIMAPAPIAMKPDTPLIAAHLFVFLLRHPRLR